ncbi:MAG: hypothetical protein ACJAWH_001323 [Maribacter sp.]|jgi:hypothetical protein
MDSIQTKINTQVFIKKKILEGKINQLSGHEEIDLKKWLNGLN